MITIQQKLHRQASSDPSIIDPRALGATGVVRWHALAAAALLSLVLGATFQQGLTAEHSFIPTARRGLPTNGLSSLPQAAQGSVSATLGAGSPAYHLSAVPGGFRAANPAQRMHASFGHWGVLISSGAVRVGLSLRAAGYGSALRPLPSVSPNARGNRVSYSYGELSGWYLNGPLGVEQGFTIPRPLDRHAAGPLRLSLALAGERRADLVAGSRSVAFSAKGSLLRYTGLTAVDASGRRLHSWLQLKNGQLQLSVDTTGARYPLRIDPLIQQGAKLTGSGETSPGQFGFGVALSSDGNTALIGGPGDNGHVGAAWVFTRSGGVWTQQGSKLTASGETGEGEFGWSVALSSDGNTALIGGPGDNSIVGAAWVFTRSEGVWTQQGSKLVAAVGQGEFGFSVALSSDGNTALIGGPGDNSIVGAAWVFTRSEGVWTQQGLKLTASGETGEGYFGYSVAISSDGNTALIGGPGDNGHIGAAWVFTRSGEVWTQQGSKLTGSGETGEGEFGFGVALSSNGNTALIGGPGDNEHVGAAWVFTRSGEVWTQQGSKLTGSGETGEGEFGFSVALSSDGNTTLIGGREDNGHVGAAWVFTRSGEVWTQQGSKLTASGETGEGEFGWSVALSSDGNTALIGGPGDNGHVGAAWVFTRSGGVWTQQGSKLTGSGETSPGEFGWSVALSSDGNTALIGGPGDNGHVGAAWVFTRSGEVWTQQGSKLTASGETGEGYFGWSVALSSDGNTALIGGPGDNSIVGAAWVFTRSGGVWTQQGSKLTGSGETGEGEFGWSVALSSDGNTALIGGPGDNSIVGAAWVFTRSGGVWTQQGSKLTGSGETGPGEFGWSVALSSDGNTALIGGPGDNGHVGAAWVFTRSGGVWTQQGSKLTASGETGEGYFGYSVALSSDGNTALIGGPGDNGHIGAAWVFTRSGEVWTQQGEKLVGNCTSSCANEGTGESGAGQFGSYVALSGNGNTALIGGNGDGSFHGAAWVFTRSGSTWTRQGEKLTPSDSSGLNPNFGLSVALSGEGSTALIGGSGDNAPVGQAIGIGAAWVFVPLTLTPPVNTTPPSLSVSGSAVQGQELTVLDGSWTNSPTSFTHQWQRCDASGNNCTPIPEATGQTYPLTAADIGSTIRVQETASNEAGAGTPASSQAVGPVIAPPANTAPPTISGTAQQGQALTVANGSWANSPTSFTHQWQRCDASGNNCTPIPEATGQTYPLTAADIGSTIRVQETASNAAGTGTPVSSLAVGPVVILMVPENTVPPSLSVSGRGVQGQAVIVANGSWTNSPTSFTHQWQRCDATGSNCTPIPEATGQTYTLTAADVGSTIRVQETASNEAGAGTPASSQAVGPVIAPPGFSPPHGTRITISKVKRKKRSASFSFSAQGTVVGFQCELQGPKLKDRHKKLPRAAFGPCSSPKSYRHLRSGTYTFLVRAFNGAGADPSPASTKFTLSRSLRVAKRL